MPGHWIHTVPVDMVAPRCPYLARGRTPLILVLVNTYGRYLPVGLILAHRKLALHSLSLTSLFLSSFSSCGQASRTHVLSYHLMSSPWLSRKSQVSLWGIPALSVCSASGSDFKGSGLHLRRGKHHSLSFLLSSLRFSTNVSTAEMWVCIRPWTPLS